MAEMSKMIDKSKGHFEMEKVGIEPLKKPLIIPNSSLRPRIKCGVNSSGSPVVATRNRAFAGMTCLEVALIFIAVSIFFFLMGCGPKQRVVIGQRMPLPERPEIRREARLPPETKLEKRETREVQYGVASWYGGEFHGRPTSSGEVYDMFELTCAHNSLPLGTMVMVTNLENGRSVELKVNDRGPFVKDRIIDVSYAAARILGMLGKGTANVKVEWIGSPLVDLVERFHLQVGSFREEARARDLAKRLKNSFDNVYVATIETQTQRYHRVRLGPFDSKEAALLEASKLSEMGFNVLVTTR